MSAHMYDLHPELAPAGTTWVGQRTNGDFGLMWVRLDGNRMLLIWHDGKLKIDHEAHRYEFSTSSDVERFDVEGT